MSEHGTHAAWNRHIKAREKACESCAEFQRNYMRNRRLRLGTGRALTFPLEVGLDDFDGVGASIARGMRECA